MIAVTATLCVTLLGLAFMQTIYVVRFSLLLKRQSKSDLYSDDDCPQANVVMCIRGADPGLEDCLNAVVNQNYPNFTFHAVVDNENDSALQAVQDICSGSPNVLVHVLNNPIDTCSLKCSSLVQAFSELDEFEFVALLDSDTVPDENWLRRLASGFDGSDIGAVSAIRWYCPPNYQTGTLVRYVWNAAAIVQMVLYRIAWGGSLAIRRNVIEELELTKYWRKSFCEDTMMKSLLDKKNYKIAFGPGLIVVNRETCSLQEFAYWLSRQLLTVRLYHPYWSLVVGHAVGTTIAIFATLAMAIFAAGQGHLNEAILLTIALATYQIINVWLLRRINLSVLVNCDDKTIIPGVPIMQIWFASVLAQIVYFWAVFRTSVLRSVTWRGIEYQINGPWDIRLKEYTPYEPVDGADKRSL